MMRSEIQADLKLVTIVLPLPLRAGSQLWDTTPNSHLNSGTTQVY